MRRFFFSILSLILLVMVSYGQDKNNVREPAAAGRFYPANGEVLKKEVMTYLASFKGPDKGVLTRAIIVPHAGYIFSGHTAAAAFASIPADADYDNIFIIGTSHRYSYEGAAVYCSGDFLTPLGTVQVNKEIGQKLIESSVYLFSKDDAHMQEHSLEVQLPFIQCHFNKDIPIVPILVGTGNPLAIKAIAKALQPWFTSRNLFVISSDFSHYPSYEDACRVDKLTMESILSGNPDTFMKTIKEVQSEGTDGLATAMCGWSSGLVLLYLTTNEHGLTYKHLEYRNSGDATQGDKVQVVGYHAITVQQTKKAATSSDTGFILSDNEKKLLLQIARDAIKAKLFSTKMVEIDPVKLTPVLKQNLGAFVTLTIDGQLRGCIGRFMPSDPLYEVVKQMAVSAAFNDSRFQKLTVEEYPDIKIEISVLGPLRKINNINEIVIGKHGVYIKKGIYSGTLLPQVPIGRNWSVEDFLGYTSRDKAGIGWTGWKDAEIFVYEAIVFDE
jgi:MEMO1 family protein